MKMCNVWCCFFVKIDYLVETVHIFKNVGYLCGMRNACEHVSSMAKFIDICGRGSSQTKWIVSVAINEGLCSANLILFCYDKVQNKQINF